MWRAGILGPEARVELLDGIITEKMGNGPAHDLVVRLLLLLFVQRLGGRHAIGTQSSVDPGPNSRPEPDLWVSRQADPAHRDALVDRDNLLLVVEVADSSLARDRDVKLPLYAAAGIPEYWIADVNEEAVTVYTAPRPSPELPGRDFTYDTEQRYGVGATITHALVGDVSVAAVFGRG